MAKDKVSLKISVSPRDHRYIEYLLPHQLRMWHSQVDEVLIVFDYHGYDDDNYKKITAQINSFITALSETYTKIKLIEVDYSEAARKEVSNAYFNGKKVPDKTHRYGPYYSYFYGLYKTSFDYIFSIDCDMFFGGHDDNWVQEAIQLLQVNPEVITCSPLPGAPTANGALCDQPGQMDDSPLRKIYFDNFSTRLFFIYKPTFLKTLCPIPIKIATWPLVYRALLRGRPIYALPEDVFTDTMNAKKLKRIDFLGTSEGIWSLHPPFRNDAFYENLSSLVKKIEKGDVPAAQRGYYDINDSMINWDDAREEIRQASMKRKLLKFFGLK
jgi:hypothetical protein